MAGQPVRRQKRAAVSRVWVAAVDNMAYASRQQPNKHVQHAWIMVQAAVLAALKQFETTHRAAHAPTPENVEDEAWQVVVQHCAGCTCTEDDWLWLRGSARRRRDATPTPSIEKSST